MSLSHSLRCVFAEASRPRGSRPNRHFHSSLRHHAKHTPKHPSVKASDLGVIQKSPAELYKPYTASEKAALAKRYTPAQLAAIEAGEAAIDVNDLASQGALRTDPMALKYVDDFATIRPVIDKPIRAPESNYDPNLRYKEEDEIVKDLSQWVENLDDDASPVEWMKFVDNTRLTVGKEEAELNPRSYLAPEIPKIIDPDTRFEAEDGISDGKAVDKYVARLIKQSGFTTQQISKFRVKCLISHRVVNQTRMGKIQSEYNLAVAGNGKGLLGIGEGKSTEPEDARRQASLAAIKNLQPIPMYERRTIYGDVKGKVGATELELMTRPPGTCYPRNVIILLLTHTQASAFAANH